jgi:hypothetical protein
MPLFVFSVLPRSTSSDYDFGIIKPFFYIRICLKLAYMNFSMTGQEKGDLLIQVTA